jgi:serine O-acetyltransferase
MFDNLREDLRSYGGDPTKRGFWTMIVYRFGRWRYTISSRVLRVPFSILYKLMKIHVESITGTELPCEAVVGRRLRIEHSFDIVVSGDAVLGDDVILRNGVTIGLRHEGKRGSPVIGNRVDIGAGAKILGPINIGDDVSIGANAVVIRDVPARCIAVGVPARILAKQPIIDAEAIHENMIPAADL